MTVYRRTTRREFTNGIWVMKINGEDGLIHAVRSFLRICLLSFPSRTAFQFTP